MLRPLGVVLFCFACGETELSRATGTATGGEPAVSNQCDATEPSGSAILDGAVVLASPSDAAALANVSQITGVLSVLNSYSGPLRLPNLRQVGGIEINGTPSEPKTPNQLTALELPNLTQVSGQIWIYLAWNLVDADLRSLAAVGDRIFIHRNVALQTLRLDALTAAGSFELTGNLSLPSCMTEAVLLGQASANGDADTRCHCETVCDHPQGVCD